MINWDKYSYKVEGKKTSRRKNKYVNPSYNVEDLFRNFRQTNSEKKVLKDVKQDVFKKVIAEYNKVLSNYIVEGFVVKLPFMMGELGIRKRKLKFIPDEDNKLYLPVDKSKLQKGQRHIFHINAHSNYWQARYFWNKRHCIIENQSYYSFKPCPINQRKLGKSMKTEGGYLKYFEAKPYYPKK